ncbi:MAG: 16S rRNA processing protein RimM [Acidobacteriota bacterium]|nr:16S rRNA processing protein RimM [Acidobacteriota bacterium]
MVPVDEQTEWTWLARIKRPQGRRGEVFAEILTDYPEKFTERQQVWLLSERPGNKANNDSAPCAAEITNHWLHKGGIVLHFAGSASISDAEKLAGLVVAIPRSERMPLGEDEAYIGDLTECELVDVSGNEPVTVGHIADVDRSSGPVALLIVDSPRGEVLVPFAKSYLRKLDLANKRVEMALPEGLVDLN